MRMENHERARMNAERTHTRTRHGTGRYHNIINTLHCIDRQTGIRHTDAGTERSTKTRSTVHSIFTLRNPSSHQRTSSIMFSLFQANLTAITRERWSGAATPEPERRPPTHTMRTTVPTAAPKSAARHAARMCHVMPGRKTRRQNATAQTPASLSQARQRARAGPHRYSGTGWPAPRAATAMTSSVASVEVGMETVAVASPGAMARSTMGCAGASSSISASRSTSRISRRSAWLLPEAAVTPTTARTRPW
mmetsp:Transcript_7981/g.25662  ORF Transcript_7981/g.25662 Transcript_7981/m.25662 type:complete len:250 (+) Transcript_7981:35-784(+)